MLVPIEWLKDYIDLDVTTEEFCDRMISRDRPSRHASISVRKWKTW